MAANEPEVLIGTAPEARYWLLRCEDQQTEQPVEEDYWAMAAEFADSVGVDIISSSLGYNDYDNHPNYYHQRDLDGNTSFISHTASMLAGAALLPEIWAPRSQHPWLRALWLVCGRLSLRRRLCRLSTLCAKPAMATKNPIISTAMACPTSGEPIWWGE